MPNSGSAAPSISIGKLKILDMRMPHANDQHGHHHAGSFALSVNAALSRLHGTGGLDPNTRAQACTQRKFERTTAAAKQCTSDPWHAGSGRGLVA